MDQQEEAAIRYADELCDQFEDLYVTYTVSALNGEIQRAFLAGAKSRLGLCDQQLVHKAVRGALVSTIKQHGPISFDLVSSATKRVVGGLKQIVQQLTEVNNGKL